MEKAKYKSCDIMEQAGITKIQLSHWINMGAIDPLVDDRRRGGVRYFSQQNMVEALVCKALNGHRLPVNAIAYMLLCVRDVSICDRKTFFQAFNDDPRIDFFALAIPMTGFKKAESTEGSVAIAPKVPLDASWKKKAMPTHMPILATTDEVMTILCEVPTAIVVNLSNIAREAGGV